jgi:hypothetical protein
LRQLKEAVIQQHFLKTQAEGHDVEKSTWSDIEGETVGTSAATSSKNVMKSNANFINVITCWL